MTQNKDEGATYVTQSAASTPDVLDISELLSTNPFDGVEQDRHITLEDILDKEFMILDIHAFDSAKKGAGSISHAFRAYHPPTTSLSR